MSASERAAQLRAQAEALEAVGGLEDAYEEALDAYREDPTEENKAAYLAAKEAFVAARTESRGDRAGLSITAEED